MTWQDVLDRWEERIALFEAALESEERWDEVINDELSFLDDIDGLGEPTRDLLPRFQMLSQRTAVLEQRITDEGVRVVGELAAITEFNASRRTTENSTPSMIDSRV